MKGLAIGQKASTVRTFTAEEISAYRRLTGDAGLAFGETAGGESAIVPGPLLAGMFSDLLGTKLPGRGTNWLKQRLAFPAATGVGEELTATVEIIRLRPEKQLINLQTTCTNSAGELLCSGEALVLVNELEEGIEPGKLQSTTASSDRNHPK